MHYVTRGGGEDTFNTHEGLQQSLKKDNFHFVRKWGRLLRIIKKLFQNEAHIFLKKD